MGGRLENKNVFITGAAGGQGQAAALAFAREGAHLCLCDYKSNLDETLSLLKKVNPKEVLALPSIDLTDESDIDNWFVQGVDVIGAPDVLYNNASNARFAPIESMVLEDWKFTLDNELTLIFLAVKRAIPEMKARGGSIINTGSIAGMAGGGAFPGGLAHAATKGGVIAMSTFMAVELAQYNIRVNTISPGLVDTPGLKPFLDDSGLPIRSVFRDAQLISRIASASDIVGLALFLASDESALVTGSNFLVDGGLIASGSYKVGMQSLVENVVSTPR